MRKVFLEWPQCYTEKGIVVNSWTFSELPSDEAIMKMQERLKKNDLGGVC